MASEEIRIVHVIDHDGGRCGRCDLPLPEQLAGRSDLEGCGYALDPENADDAQILSRAQAHEESAGYLLCGAPRREPGALSPR